MTSRIKAGLASTETRASRVSGTFGAAFLLAASLANLSANQMTVNVSQRSANLKKAGLGSLFGIVTNNTGPWMYYMTNAFLFVSEHQSRIGEGTHVPPSTSAVAPVIRGTPIRMMCRFGDLCYGWSPYTWPGLTSSWRAPGASYSWLEQVTNAVNDIKNNYSDVVYAVAIFNEPEGQLWDTNFYNDPNITGTAQEQRINYVWTQTYRTIKALSPALKIMGPNYEDYRPQYYASHQTLMHDFLTNAIATGTVPNIIGWHNLNANPIAPGDIGTALNNYYRPLEASLGVPAAPLPVSIEEFGANNGAFEGIPGQMVPYWAELERDGVDFASMGIYENGGDLGNTMRYTMWDATPEPNAGWFMMNWYLQMQGQYVPVTAQGIDGVASWDSTNRTLTILFGGNDGDTTVQVNGLGALGLGNTVRVRLDMLRWTTNSNVAITKTSCGGDPQTGAYNLYDKNFALDPSGNLSVPVNAVDGIYNGYRVLITSSNSPDIYPTKYEAEQAICNHAIVYGGGTSPQSSAGTYVGGIDYTDSFVCFHVSAPTNGLYTMFIRYAANSAYGPATHFVTINGQSQGVVNYPPTVGWANAELRTTARLISLARGMNDIMLSHATNYAELDFIDVRPDTHRYEAELATNNNVALKSFNTCYIPDCVGAINNTDSYVNFSVQAPVSGAYLLSVGYANGTSSTATHAVSVNGITVGTIVYPPTGGWLGGGWLTGSNPSLVTRTSTLPVTLIAGLNTLRLTHANNYAELDYITLLPNSNLTPSIPRLTVANLSDGNVAISWPLPGAGYSLQQTVDLAAANWSVVTNPVNVVNARNQILLPRAASNAFFRLYP